MSNFKECCTLVNLQMFFDNPLPFFLTFLLFEAILSLKAVKLDEEKAKEAAHSMSRLRTLEKLDVEVPSNLELSQEACITFSGPRNEPSERPKFIRPLVIPPKNQSSKKQTSARNLATNKRRVGAGNLYGFLIFIGKSMISKHETDTVNECDQEMSSLKVPQVAEEQQMNLNSDKEEAQRGVQLKIEIEKTPERSIGRRVNKLSGIKSRSEPSYKDFKASTALNGSRSFTEGIKSGSNTVMETPDPTPSKDKELDETPLPKQIHQSSSFFDLSGRESAVSVEESKERSLSLMGKDDLLLSDDHSNLSNSQSGLLQTPSLASTSNNPYIERLYFQNVSQPTELAKPVSRKPLGHQIIQLFKRLVCCCCC